MEILLAVLLGGFFGFALDRVGANNPNNIINMLKLTDLRLMRIILGAIGVSSILMFGALSLGLMDVGHLSIKEAYTGVFVGGLILGVGFALSGYCPGTGLTAFAVGRKDALFFLLGGFVGAGLYMWSFQSIKDSFLFEKTLGGKVSLGVIENSGYEAVFQGMNGNLIGIVLGLVFILLAWKLPAKLRG